MMKPTAGKIYFDGKLWDRKDLSKIGALIENPPIYEKMCIRDRYEGYKIGPVIRDFRKDKGLLIEEVAAKTGISVSTLGQVEQGGRRCV